MFQRFQDFYCAVEPLLITLLYVALFIATIVSVVFWISALAGCSTPTTFEGPPPIEWSAL